MKLKPAEWLLLLFPIAFAYQFGILCDNGSILKATITAIMAIPITAIELIFFISCIKGAFKGELSQQNIFTLILLMAGVLAFEVYAFYIYNPD